MKDAPAQLSPSAIGRILPDGRVLGEGVPPLSEDQKDVLRGEKPTAHKIGGMIICTAPLGPGAALLHCYNKLPSGVRLTEAIAHVARAAQEEGTATTLATPTALATDPAVLAPSADGASAKTAAATRADPIAKAFADSFDMPAKARLELFLSGLADAGLRGVVGCATITNGKLRRLALQKQEYEPHRDALIQVLKTVLGAQADDAETALDRSVLARSLGGSRIDLVLPAARDRAVALVTLDAPLELIARLREHLPYLAPLNPERASTARVRQRGKTGVLLGAALGLVVYLGWPAPIYVSNFAVSRAADTRIVALPFGAFLEDVGILAGETAPPGETLVRLRAPNLEDSLSEQAIQRQLEEINAQEAIERGNIAEFQLAEKRNELASLREAQLRERARFLDVVSTEAARVISVQSQSDKGMFLPEGTPVITLQTSPGFNVVIDVKPADATRLAAGQTGHVQFRGLSSQRYPVTVLSPPVQVEDPDSPTPILQVRARLDGDTHRELIHGLRGYAKVETGHAPRIVGLTRPFRDYIRVSIWTYLGITF